MCVFIYSASVSIQCLKYLYKAVFKPLKYFHSHEYLCIIITLLSLFILGTASDPDRDNAIGERSRSQQEQLLATPGVSVSLGQNSLRITSTSVCAGLLSGLLTLSQGIPASTYFA